MSQGMSVACSVDARRIFPLASASVLCASLIGLGSTVLPFVLVSNLEGGQNITDDFGYYWITGLLVRQGDYP